VVGDLSMKVSTEVIEEYNNAGRIKLKSESKYGEYQINEKRKQRNTFELEDNLDDIWFSLWNGI